MPSYQDPILAIISGHSAAERSQMNDLLIRLLSQVQLFDDFHQNDLLEMLNILEKVTFPAEKFIFHEGDFNEESLYILISGEVLVMNGVATKNPVEVAKLSPGESFGEMALIDNKPRSASIRTINHCTVLKLKKNSLISHPGLAAKLLLNISRLLAARLRNFNRRCELFAATSWANGMTSHEIRTFSNYLDIKFYLKGDVILKEGEDESFMCIITEGQVHILKEDSSNRNKIIATLSKGQSFGEMSLFDGYPRSATVAASRNTSILVLKRESLIDMIRDTPSIAAKFTIKLGSALSKRLRRMDNKTIEFFSNMDKSDLTTE